MGEDLRASSQPASVEPTEGCYLVKERKPDLSFRLFKRLLRRGYKGLIITRRHPSKLRRNRGLQDARIVWLSHTPGEDFHNPTALGSLNKLICRFIQENERTAVLLDGLEYLILNNNFVQTLLFVEHVNEFVMQHPSIVLIPIDPGALEVKELALLERNLEVLEGEDLRRELDREEVIRLIDTY
jgi:two-component system cell cycle response regulator